MEKAEPTQILKRARLCRCSHPDLWHEQLPGGKRGVCQHGCGCTAFHTRRQRDACGVETMNGELTLDEPSAAELLEAWRLLREAGDRFAEKLRAMPTHTFSFSPMGAPPGFFPPLSQGVKTTTIRGVSSFVRERPARKGKGMPVGERAVLTAAAQHAQGVTREQLSVLTGYKRSSRDSHLQRLRAADHVEFVDDTIIATGKGRAALGPDFAPLPKGAKLREYWLERLPEGERRVLEVFVDAFPGSRPRSAVDTATGYQRSSRDSYIQRLRSRKLVKVVERGEVRASEELFS